MEGTRGAGEKGEVKVATEPGEQKVVWFGLVGRNMTRREEGGTREGGRKEGSRRCRETRKNISRVTGRSSGGKISK